MNDFYNDKYVCLINTKWSFHVPIPMYNFIQTNVLRKSFIMFKRQHLQIRPIPVAAQFKMWVCGRSLAGIVGLNTAWACMSLVSVLRRR